MDDLISRQVALKALRPIMRKSDYFYEMLKAIQDVPPAEPERKKGKWINGVCDQCGSHAPYWAMASTYYRSSFCPNCGADMRGEE